MQKFIIQFQCIFNQPQKIWLWGFSVTEKLAQTSISLPVHEFITKKQLDFIVKIIKQAVI